MAIVCAVLAGIFVASLLGHWIHVAIHQRWMGSAYRAHMHHHVELYPPGRLASETYLRAAWMNSGTFLFTPPLVAVMGTSWFVMGAMGAELGARVAFCVTVLAFALVNDAIHDDMHVAQSVFERFGWYRRIRAAHYEHHRNMRRNFGIVTLFWDRVFGTRSRRWV